MTAQAPSGVYAEGVWVVDAESIAAAEEEGKRSAMRGGWVPIQVHWVETPEENDARILSTQRRSEAKR